MIIKPLKFGENDNKREGFIFLRYCNTDNIETLLNGIYILNKSQRPPGEDHALFGPYFSGMGRANDKPIGDIEPVNGSSEVIVKLPGAPIVIEDMAKGQRYVVLIALKVDQENFSLFKGKIGEVQSGWGERQTHNYKIIGEYEELKGWMAMINTFWLKRKDLEDLGSDLKILVYDRDNPREEMEFRPYTEVVRDLEASLEARRGISKEVDFK